MGGGDQGLGAPAGLGQFGQATNWMNPQNPLARLGVPGPPQAGSNPPLMGQPLPPWSGGAPGVLGSPNDPTGYAKIAGPYRSFNNQTNKWGWNPGGTYAGKAGPNRRFNPQTGKWEWDDGTPQGTPL